MFRFLHYLIVFIVTIFLSEFSDAQVLDFRYEQFDTDDGLPSSEVYDLIEDPAGNIWLTTDRGVVKYDGYDFITYDMDDGLANLANFSFLPLGDGTFWINGLDGSLSFWDGTCFTPFIYNKVIKSLRPNESSWMEFLGTKDDLLFFHIISPSDSEITFPVYSINIYNGTIDEHRKNFGGSLTMLKYSDQLIRRRINIVINRKVIEHSISKNGKGSISKTHFQWDTQGQLKKMKSIDHTIIGIYIDNNGGEWITTKSGVYYFKNGDLSLEPEIFLNGVSVTSIYESRDGSLWVTSTDNGLFHIPNINIRMYKPNGWVEGEAVYKLKNIDNYLLAKSEKRNVFTLNVDQSDALGYYFDYYPLDLLPLENNLFLKYNTIGFNIISDVYTPFYKYKFRTLSATKDTNNILWIATTEGLFKWLPDYVNTYPETTLIGGEKTLRINDVIADQYGVWVVTPKFGLVYKTESSEYILEHEKLENKTLQCIFKQNDTTLWVGSNSGLHKIKYKFDNGIPRIEKLEVFTISQGLISNFINDISFWNDKIWLATDEGLCHFSPNQLASITTAPLLQINYLEAKKKKLKIFDRVTLNHDENDVSIAYTGISHNKPKNGFYSYKINDKSWVTTDERKVSFLNLNHGEYNFSVKSRSDSGIWSKTASLTFIITPHFLEQLWFRILIICILCIIAFMSMMRYRRNWKKKLANENRLRNSELTTLRNQMNPHFMFNSLTAIQGLIYKGKKNEANTYIGKFSRLMRKSLEYSKLENIRLNEEITFIENYLELEKKRFKNLFEYQIIVDPKLDKNLLIPPLLLQPLLENSIKHGLRGISKNGYIEITLKKHHINEVFEVIIKDNGIGMNIAELSKPKGSMGLGIVKDRINLIRENSDIKEISFYIESEKGKGTTIRLLLPLNL